MGALGTEIGRNCPGGVFLGATWTEIGKNCPGGVLLGVAGTEIGKNCLGVVFFGAAGTEIGKNCPGEGEFLCYRLFYGSYYPITTSSTIMSAKPRAKPTVAMLECSPCEASGISSSTMT